MARYVPLCLLLLLSSSACEVVADFDPNKLNRDRTIGPVPIPSLDGALAVMPDASQQDGALIKPPEPPDAEVSVPSDAGADLDAEMQAPSDAAAIELDTGVGAADAARDSGNEDAASHDISFADAAPK